MTTLHIDFETRSTLDLRAVGLHRYARHPTTDVWCMAWALGDMKPILWHPGLETREPLVHVQRGRRVVAHNAPFELEIWNEIMVPRYGWPVLRPEQTHCTMAQAYAMGLPGALEDAALVLGLDVQKDAEGRALMLRMARPRRIDNGKPVWWDEPEKLARLYEYCKQDVRVERALDKRLTPLSDYERRVWLMDYAINQRGVLVDVITAEAAVAMAAELKEDADDEITEITGGAAQKHTALIPIKEWIRSRGVEVDGLAKQDVVDLLEQRETLPDDVRRVLTIRQEVGRASVAKLEPMIEIAGDDRRVRNIFQYWGAATGRWAGRRLQPHNFVRDVPSQKDVETILKLVREGRRDVVQCMYGPPMTVLSRCLRGFFMAPKGRVFVAGDFAAVEGRGTAWVAGEEWKLRAFRESDAGTGPGIYELAYAKAFHVPVESIKNPSFERQVGKVMELAFGYGGGIGAFVTMGSTMGVNVPPEQADEFKVAWRAAHPKIVQMWRELEDAAKSAVRNSGTTYKAGVSGREVSYRMEGSFLWCLLPSGRCLCYPYPKLLAGKYGRQLTYMTVPSADDAKKGRLIVDPDNGPKWARVATYGGSLMENVVQAICRDLLVACMLDMHNMGAAIVLHVHDEIVIEVGEQRPEIPLGIMEHIMNTAPAWAEGFPLAATPAIMRRYGK